MSEVLVVVDGEHGTVDHKLLIGEVRVPYERA
jgi:hypothetical protein